MSSGRGKYNARRQYRPYRAEELDADNWAVIPEFGVLPDAPAFGGFSLPLSALKDRDAAESMRTMLRIARKKIRSQFPTRAAVDTAARPDGDIAPHQLSEQQQAAMAFLLIEDAIANAVHPDMPERHRVAWAAHAGAILAVWLSNDWKAMMQTLAKANGRLGGMASAKTRKHDALNKSDVILAAEEHGWPNKTKRGLRQHLAKNFHCSPDYVGEILSAEKKRRV